MWHIAKKLCMYVTYMWVCHIYVSNMGHIYVTCMLHIYIYGTCMYHLWHINDFFQGFIDCYLCIIDLPWHTFLIHLCYNIAMNAWNFRPWGNCVFCKDPLLPLPICILPSQKGPVFKFAARLASIFWQHIICYFVTSRMFPHHSFVACSMKILLVYASRLTNTSFT